MVSKFKPYEIVTLAHGTNLPEYLIKQKGVVLSVLMSEGGYKYNVCIPPDFHSGEPWKLPQEFLVSTGSFLDPKDFKSGNKFEDYEVVKILSGSELPKEIWGQEVAVLGMSQSNSGIWSYAISAPLNRPDLEDFYGHGVEEKYLEPTGKFMKHEDFYTGESIRVSIDGELLPPDE
jgi:hypothetical protein